MNAIKFIITGRVQGVFYRRFAKNKAEELRIAGWARNMTDGSVEVYAMGEASVLQEYKAQLQKGPTASKVEKVVSENVDCEQFVGFYIKE